MKSGYTSSEDTMAGGIEWVKKKNYKMKIRDGLKR